MRRLHFLLPSIATVLGLVGCGEPRAGPSTTQVDTLPSGTIRSSNMGAAWTPETAWRLEEDLRLGTAGDERVAEQFANIAAVLTDSAGAIYVLAGQSQEVRVFRPDGSFSHRIGRRGQGPGELARAAGLNFGPNGRLWVWDPGQGYAVFQTDGTFVTRYARQIVGLVFPWLGKFGPEGNLYDWSISFVGGREGNVADKVLFQPFRLSKDFQSLDTLPALEYAGGGSGNMAVPFSDGLTIYQDRRGSIWFSRYHQYAIHRRALTGDTISVFTLPATPARVTETERDSVVEQFSQLPPEFRIAPGDVPEFKPIVRRIFGDDLGYVFVVVEVEGVPAGSAVDVFAEGGTYLGRMELPEPMLLPLPAPYATVDHLYVVVTDEFDVPYVSRLRIIRPSG